VLGDAQGEVSGVHADTVVGHLNQAAAAVEDADVNPRGPGVERVLDQLLDHAGGPLDALAGGDAADEGGRQNANLAHRSQYSGDCDTLARELGTSRGERRTTIGRA
jgi:hypothetical protein